MDPEISTQDTAANVVEKHRQAVGICMRSMLGSVRLVSITISGSSLRRRARPLFQPELLKKHMIGARRCRRRPLQYLQKEKETTTHFSINIMRSQALQCLHVIGKQSMTGRLDAVNMYMWT